MDNHMIWIDGDACPREIKDIVYRASQRKSLKVNVVANSYQKIPRSLWVTLIVVEKGLDKDCIDKMEITEILDIYLLKKCKELKS